MRTPVIIDIVAAAILLGFVLLGGKRGLLRSAAGLLTVVTALVGAGMIAGTVSAPAARLLAPAIEKHIAARVDDAVADEADRVQMPEAEVGDAFSAGDLLALLGLDREVRESLADRVQETVRSTGASIAAAVVESIAQSVLYGVLFLLAFLALMLALELLTRALDLVLKLPGLHGLNALGGAAVGLIEGALLLFLAIWVGRKLGVSFDTGAAADTMLLRFFTTNTPLSVLSFLQ